MTFSSGCSQMVHFTISILASWKFVRSDNLGCKQENLIYSVVISALLMTVCVRGMLILFAQFYLAVFMDVYVVLANIVRSALQYGGDRLGRRAGTPTTMEVLRNWNEFNIMLLASSPEITEQKNRNVSAPCAKNLNCQLKPS